MLLANKNIVIYGAGGGIGRGMAVAFAREGAKLFLTGRTRAKLEAVAAEVAKVGGKAEIALVDALDAAAVNQHADDIAARAGSIDASINLIARGDIQGIPLVEMSVADFTRAAINGLTAHLHIAQAAARHMAQTGGGVILMVTSGSSRGAIPMMGSTPAADAAMESLMRCLAAELGPQGIRVLGIWTAAVPETLTPENIAEVNANMQLDAAGIEQLVQAVGQMTMLRRAPALAHVANTATFLVSEHAGSITGTMINVSSGLVSS